MKIALIGNMNNNFFSLLRFLLKINPHLNVDLFLYKNNPKRFLPESDTYQYKKYAARIKKFPVYTHLLRWTFINKRKIKRCFASYDVIVSCGEGLAYLQRAGVSTDIFIPYGADMYELVHNDYMRWSPLWLLKKNFSKWQVKAIKCSSVVVASMRQRLIKSTIDRLKLTPIDIGIPMLFPDDNEEGLLNQWAFLSGYDFILFSHTRHIWSTNPHDIDDFVSHGGNKRNDKLIRAFAEFLKLSSFQSPILILFEYGPDVADSKKLISELDIEKNIIWMPQKNRKEIMQGVCLANLVFAQAREGICGITGVAYEAMAVGTPVLAHANGAIEDKNSVFYQSPVIDVLTERDILEVLVDYESNSEKYRELGVKTKSWFNEFLGIGLARKYYDLIQEISTSGRTKLKAIEKK